MDLTFSQEALEPSTHWRAADSQTVQNCTTAGPGPKHVRHGTQDSIFPAFHVCGFDDAHTRTGAPSIACRLDSHPLTHDTSRQSQDGLCHQVLPHHPPEYTTVSRVILYVGDQSVSSGVVDLQDHRLPTGKLY